MVKYGLGLTLLHCYKVSILQEMIKDRMVSTLHEAELLAKKITGDGLVENQGLKDRVSTAIDVIQEGLVERETEVLRRI